MKGKVRHVGDDTENGQCNPYFAFIDLDQPQAIK